MTLEREGCDVQHRDELRDNNRPQTLEQWQLGLLVLLRTTRLTRRAYLLDMSDGLQRVASTSTRASAARVGDIRQLSTRVRDEKNGRVYCCQMQDL